MSCCQMCPSTVIPQGVLTDAAAGFNSEGQSDGSLTSSNPSSSEGELSMNMYLYVICI